MATVWWIYMLIASVIFVVLLIVHFVVKKINDTRTEERFTRLYRRTSKSTQVQVPLLEKDAKLDAVKSENEEKHKKHTPPKENKVSLVFSIDDNTKRYSPYSCKKNDSWTKFLGNKGVTIYSKDDVLKLSDTAVLKPGPTALLPVTAHFNSVAPTISNSDASSPSFDTLTPECPIVITNEIKNEEKDNKDTNVSNTKPVDECNLARNIVDNIKEEVKTDVDPALCNKFLGAIYCKDSFVIRKPSTTDNEKADPSDDTLKHHESSIRELPKCIPSTDIPKPSVSKPILLKKGNSSSNSKGTLKGAPSKVTFNPEISELDVIVVPETNAITVSGSYSKSYDGQNVPDQSSSVDNENNEAFVNYVTLLNEDLNAELLENITHFKDKVGLKLMESSEASTSKARQNFKLLVDHLTVCEDNIAIKFKPAEFDKELVDQIDGLQRYKNRLYSKGKQKQSSRHIPLNIDPTDENDEKKKPNNSSE